MDLEVLGPGLSTRRVLTLALVASMVSATFVACRTSRQDDLEALEAAVEGYNHAYRWQNYERAAAYLPNDLRTAFMATYEEDASSLQIESYNILKVHLESERSALVTVLVRFTLLPSVTLEKRVITQHWHKVADMWILETEENAIRPIDPAYAPSPSRPGLDPTHTQPTTSEGFEPDF